MAYTLEVKEKCVLITGASSGLGAHFAELLASSGARVVLAARRKVQIDDLCARLNQQGGSAFAVVMDVCDESSIQNALLRVESEFAPIDVLVNNAGIALTKTFLETNDEEWRRLVDTNLVGAANVARHCAISMKSREQGGAIINIGSILGMRAGNLTSAYAATKAGIIHLTRGMAIELARYNIQVNALLPGFIPTDLTDLDERAIIRLRAVIPKGRIGTPEDLDGAFMLLASSVSSYMTGSTLTVDGGHSINSL